MADLPGRPAWEPEDRADPAQDDTEAADAGGWGSPVPAEYGSLHAVRPPARKKDPAPSAAGLLSAWARGPGRRTADDPAAPAGAAPSSPELPPTADDPPADAPRLFRLPSDAAAPAEPASPDGRTDRARRPAPARAEQALRSGAGAPPAGVSRPEPQARREPVARTEAVPVVDPRPSRSEPLSEPAPWPDAPASLPADPGLADATLAGVDMIAPVAPSGLSGPDAPIGPGTPGDVGGPRPMSPLRRPVRRPGRARNRVVLRHVDVATVAKVSVLFWLLVLVVVVVAAVLLWEAANIFGTLPSLDKSVRTLFSLKKFELHPGAVAMYTAAAGLVIAVVGTLANILLALVYNLIADVVGGIRVELESFGRE